MRNFIGSNMVYNCVDILCISTKNNDDYDLFIRSDGISTARELLDHAKEEDDYVYIMAKKD